MSAADTMMNRSCLVVGKLGLDVRVWRRVIIRAVRAYGTQGLPYSEASSDRWRGTTFVSG